MKKLVGFIVLAFWVVGGLLLTPGVSFAQPAQRFPNPSACSSSAPASWGWQ